MSGKYGGHFKSATYGDWRIGWVREWWSDKAVSCAKCEALIRFEPDMPQTLCKGCLALFHKGLTRHGLPRDEQSALVLFDKFMESDAVEFSRGSEEFIKGERIRRQLEQSKLRQRSIGA